MGKKITHRSELTRYASIDELDETSRKLMLRAQKAAEGAYAPYSNFYVGATLLLETGEIIIGNNQENAAYPSGMCAERTAFFAAGANFPNVKIISAVITAVRKDGDCYLSVTPCGSCRQVMAEYEEKQNSPIKIIMQGEDNTVYISESVANLLPFKFSKDNLDS